MMIHIEDVPFDVWSHVTSFSSMKCISNLRCTSKHFYRLMSERSVWLDALRDVLEVIPLPRLRHVLPCLSSRELRTKAAMISRLDDLWSRGASHPAHIESYRPSSGIIAIEIMPGGDWVLNLFQDGSLHLHHRRNMAEHSMSVSLPTRSGWRFEGSAYMRRSFSSCGQHWVAVKDYYVTSDDKLFTDHRVYHIDVSSPSIRFLCSVTSQGYSYDLQAKGDLLVIAEQENETCILSVSKISIADGKVQKELVLNLGPELTSLRSISILCSHMILVSASFGMFLFEIPQLQPATESDLSHPVSVTPLIANGQDVAIRSALCRHHDGCVSAYAFAEHQEALVILPPLDSLSQKAVRYTLQGSSCYRNASRAIMCHDHQGKGPITFECFTHFTRSDGHVGYLRLGRTKALDPSLSVTISLTGHNGRMEDVSWDEESGRVCVIYTPLDVYNDRVMLLVDLLQ